MDPDENRSERYHDTHPVDTRSFDTEAQREAERIFRRTGGESLDEYLRNINTYLTELNARLGVQPTEPDDSEPHDDDLPAYDAPAQTSVLFDDTLREDPYRAFRDADRPPYRAPRNGPYRAFPDADLPPYGAFERSAAFAEPPDPRDAGSNWQAAVPNPELYPDLDDPAVVNPGAARKKSRKRSKKEKPPKMTKGGKSRFSFVTTLLNLGLYAGWIVLYFVSLSVRSVMFTSAQAQMAAEGVANYSLSISSPLFTVLRVMIYAMPVVILLWMRGVLQAEKKELPQVDRRLLIAAFAVDVIAGVIAVFDVMAAKLIFG